MQLRPLPAFTLLLIMAVAARAESLAQKIDAFVAQEKFTGALWAIQVAELESGRVVYEHHPHRLMSPASNSKLYTGALALETLGGDYRIRTPLHSSAKPDAEGMLAGDLVVAGRGDPSWNPRAAKKDFWTAFDPFIAELRRAGVKRIRGDIVADATWLRTTPQGASWTVDDMNDDYGAEISAITLEENFVDLRIIPGAASGEPCRLEVLQPHSGLVFENQATTGPAESRRSIRVLRLPGELTVRITGSLPVGGKTEEAQATVPRPAGWFATAFREALLKAGITVDGATRRIRWPEPSAKEAAPIGEVVSPPLREMVVDFMKPSQNLKTDLIFAHLGELRRTADTPSWKRSDELAVEALEEFMGKIGVKPGEVQFDEGSGLSRNNLTTPAATVALLRHMAKSREAEAFIASLPIAGVDGTIEKRMRGTPAEGNVRAKTGGLRWSATLSGYVTAADGRKLVFSLMLNRHRGTTERPARAEIDEIAVLLAAHRDTP